LDARPVRLQLDELMGDVEDDRYFVVHDYSTRVLSTPALRAQFAPARTGWLARAPAPVLAALKPLLPAHIWILQKT